MTEKDAERDGRFAWGFDGGPTPILRDPTAAELKEVELLETIRWIEHNDD